MEVFLRQVAPMPPNHKLGLGKTRYHILPFIPDSLHSKCGKLEWTTIQGTSALVELSLNSSVTVATIPWKQVKYKAWANAADGNHVSLFCWAFVICVSFTSNDECTVAWQKQAEMFFNYKPKKLTPFECRLRKNEFHCIHKHIQQTVEPKFHLVMSVPKVSPVLVAITLPEEAHASGFVLMVGRIVPKINWATAAWKFFQSMKLYSPIPLAGESACDVLGRELLYVQPPFYFSCVCCGKMSQLNIHTLNQVRTSTEYKIPLLMAAPFLCVWQLWEYEKNTQIHLVFAMHLNITVCFFDLSFPFSECLNIFPYCAFLWKLCTKISWLTLADTMTYSYLSSGKYTFYSDNIKPSFCEHAPKFLSFCSYQ